MAHLKEDEWPEPGEDTTAEQEAELRTRATGDAKGAAEPPEPDSTAAATVAGCGGTTRTA